MAVFLLFQTIYAVMNAEKLKQLEAQVRIGGKVRKDNKDSTECEEIFINEKRNVSQVVLL